jgi:TolB-like protein/Tfp pilus assembly protein PilF
MIGRTLGHYRVLEKIGAGGMGEVYRARDEHLDRDVAVKVLPAGLLVDEAARRRFRKEALALARLNHPNIATVHDFATHAGIDALVTEYVPGQSLDERLLGVPLEEKEVVRFGQQLAEGLAAAHGEGVVHRDLKPANLRVMPDGRLKILDFGVARLLGPAESDAATETVTAAEGAVGTLPYMAPEQMRGERADARADIWSAGVVLYEMATGRRPFEAKLSTALAADIQTKPSTPPRARNPKLSPRLEEIILKCLEKEPENRYQSAKELAVDLRRLAQSATGAAPAAVASRSRRARITGVAAAGVLAAGFVAAALNVAGLRGRLTGGEAAPRITSLAVLPLTNLMNDPEQDYFVDGMHEALTAELSKISALKVIARTSTMRYKHTRLPAREIARELRVDGLIEGSVLREGNQVRITVQLIHAPTDRHLWAQSFDREFRSILVLYSDVARAIASEIRISVTPEERRSFAVAGSAENPEAYQTYLRGRYHWNRRTEEDFRKAIEHFNRAIELDPRYPPAFTGLADSYSLLGTYEVLPPREAYSRAKAAAVKALEMDARNAEAHTSLAWVRFRYDWDWVGAEQSFRRAIELNPNYATAHHWYARFLAAMGRFAEAEASARRAHELDPLSPIINTVLGEVFLFSRRYDEAIRQLETTLELDSSFAYGVNKLAHAYALKGMYPQAIATSRKASSLPGARPWFLAELGYVYALAGRERDAWRILKELEELSKRRYVSAYTVAHVYIGLGDRQHALDWLERAYEERSSLLTEFTDPLFDGLREDPQFKDLIRRMNFPGMAPR